MEIELKVEGHYSSSNSSYSVHWRKISNLNAFFDVLNILFDNIGWHEIMEVWDGAMLERYSSKRFSYSAAFEYAKKLKANPELIAKHEKEQDDVYIKAKERRKTEYRTGKII